MRPRVSIRIGIGEELEKHLLKVLAEKGPLSEKELWEEAVAFFDPKLRPAAAKLRRLYRASFGHRIGQKTAEINVVRGLRSVLSDVKQELPHTDRPVQLGKLHFGRVFYASGQEEKVREKVREIVQKNPSRAKEVLDSVKKGPVWVSPSYKRAVDMLEHYGLVEIQRLGGKVYAVEPGWAGETRIESKPSGGLFPKGFKVWKPFSATIWVLREGPEKQRIRFDVAAWDPANRIFYLGAIKEHLGLSDLKSLREKALLLHLPAKMVAFYKNTSESAARYAQTWGIDMKQI